MEEPVQGQYDPPEDSVFRYAAYIERAFSSSTVEEIMKALVQQIHTAQNDGLDPGPLNEMHEAMLKACPLSMKVDRAL